MNCVIAGRGPWYSPDRERTRGRRILPAEHLRRMLPRLFNCASTRATRGARRFGSIASVSRSRSWLKPPRTGPAIYVVEAFSKGKQVAKQELHFPEKPPYSARVTLDGVVTADELVLSATTGEAVSQSSCSAGDSSSGIRSRGGRYARHDRQPRRPGHDPRSFGLAAPGPGANGDARDGRDQPHPRLAQGPA